MCSLWLISYVTSRSRPLATNWLPRIPLQFASFSCRAQRHIACSLSKTRGDVNPIPLSMITSITKYCRNNARQPPHYRRHIPAYKNSCRTQITGVSFHARADRLGSIYQLLGRTHSVLTCASHEALYHAAHYDEQTFPLPHPSRVYCTLTYDATSPILMAYRQRIGRWLRAIRFRASSDDPLVSPYPGNTFVATRIYVAGVLERPESRRSCEASVRPVVLY